MSYFVKIKGKALGPFSAANVLDMIRQGRVGKSTSVSQDRVTWKKAEEFDEIFPKSNSATVMAFVQQNKADEFEMSDAVWLVSRNGQAVKGPFTGTAVIGMIQKRMITANTFVWKKGDQMLPVSQCSYFQEALAQQTTGLEDFGGPAVPVSMPVPVERRAISRLQLTPQDAKRINSSFYWFYGLLTTATLTLILAFFFSAMCEGSCENGIVPGGVLMTIGYICSVLFFATYVLAFIVSVPFAYNVWRVVPPECASTTPAKAAWFLLIPLFNLGWQFIAFGGLAKSLNRALDERRSMTRSSVGACIVYCIFNIIALGLPNIIVAPYAFNSLRKASVELVRLTK